MRRIFVDTAHLLGVLSPRDNLHASAVSVAADLSHAGDLEFVTTHLVVAELLTALARRGGEVRERATAYVESFYAQPSVVVVERSGALFERALHLYRDRQDKAYSLVDCVSMVVVCRDLEITDVLSSDHDFEQEGFAILLRVPA